MYIYIYIYSYVHIHIYIRNICFMRTAHNQIAALLIPAGLQFPTPCMGLRRSPGSAAGGGGSALGATQPMAAGVPGGVPLYPKKIPK
jgi:hypothetical protein